MRPRRRVVETDAGFEVACSGFVSSDRVLALAVRDELDRVDPLPCPHDGDTVEISWALSSRVEARCADCGVGLPDACDDTPAAVSWPREGVEVGDALAVFVEEFAARRHGPATLLRLDERRVDLR